eukprot:g32853.t1
METVKDVKLLDVFRNPADGAQCRCTSSQPDGSICSRIDFLFVSRVFSVRSTDIKLVFLPDHCLLLANCHLQDGKGTWMPNVKLLTPENIEELKRDYTVYKESSVLSGLKEEDGLVLDNSMWERLDQLISLDKMAKVLKSFGKNKTVGSDGFPAELYSALWDLIDQDLLEVYDRQEGITCLISLEEEKAFDRISHMTDDLEVLGIWFRGAGAKAWEECVRRYTNTKCHYSLRFYLSPVLQRMGLASLPWNAPSSWTIPYHLSFVEKFMKENTFDHKSIKQWSARSILETLWEKERVDFV